MVELTGKTSKTNFSGGKVESTWRIPAQSESLAKRQAKVNERVKGRSNVEVGDVEKIEDGDLPGQSIYSVETVADR